MGANLLSRGGKQVSLRQSCLPGRTGLHFTGGTVHGLFEFYFVSDEDMRKDPQSTIEMLSHMIEESMKEIDSRKAQRPQHLNLQLDNTSRENRNVTVMTWLAWLVAERKFHTATWNGLMVAHTHIDQDQRFSVCGATLARKPRLENPDEFMAAIREVPPSRLRTQRVEHQRVARNWQNFLVPLNVAMEGHTGKNSVHSYTFARYEDLLIAHGDRVDVGVHDLEVQSGDVFLLTRDNMSSRVLSQPPALILPQVNLAALDRARVLPGQGLVVMKRNEICADTVNKYRKMANAVD